MASFFERLTRRFQRAYNNRPVPQLEMLLGSGWRGRLSGLPRKRIKLLAEQEHAIAEGDTDRRWELVRLLRENRARTAAVANVLLGREQTHPD